MLTCTEGDGVPLAERMMMTVAEIVKILIQAHQEGRDVNLNKYICTQIITVLLQ